MTNTSTIILICAAAYLGIITIKRLLDGYRSETIVWKNQLALHFKDGCLAGQLTPGKHVFFGKGNSVISYDRRQQAIVVKCPDLITADRATLKVNAVIHFSISDAARMFTAAGSPNQVLCTAVQPALREIVGATPISRLLENADSYARALTPQATRAGAAVGLEVERVEIRDVILGCRSSPVGAGALSMSIASQRPQVTSPSITDAHPNLLRLCDPEQIAHGDGSTLRLLGQPEELPNPNAANP